MSAVEIWLASWNLGLEWRGDWPEFEGAGRYNQVSAARLDAILDAAWANRIRINLVIYNHGMASPRMDSEWKDNPYNARQGGPLQDPLEIFTSAAAQRGQDSLRRYLIARYADHPAILGLEAVVGDQPDRRGRDGRPHGTGSGRRGSPRRAPGLAPPQLGGVGGGGRLPARHQHPLVERLPRRPAGHRHLAAHRLPVHRRLPAAAWRCEPA